VVTGKTNKTEKGILIAVNLMMQANKQTIGLFLKNQGNYRKT
jgi:hypothetical protein